MTVEYVGKAKGEEITKSSQNKCENSHFLYEVILNGPRRSWACTTWSSFMAHMDTKEKGKNVEEIFFQKFKNCVICKRFSLFCESGRNNTPFHEIFASSKLEIWVWDKRFGVQKLFQNISFQQKKTHINNSPSCCKFITSRFSCEVIQGERLTDELQPPKVPKDVGFTLCFGKSNIANEDPLTFEMKNLQGP